MRTVQKELPGGMFCLPVIEDSLACGVEVPV